MNSLHLQMTLLNAASAVVGFAANWLLQSTLLIAAGLTLGWLVRHRGSALQSVIYRTTLTAVILCPLATFLLSQGGISGWSIEMPVAWTFGEQSAIASESSKPSPIASAIRQSLGDEPDVLANSERDSRVMEAAQRQGETSLDKPLKAGSTASVPFAVATSMPATSTVPAETWLFEIRSFGLAALGIAFLWLAVSSVLLLRLRLAWRQLARIRAGAARAEASIQQDCHDLARILQVSPPEVLLSPYLTSPCLVGWLRPAVLLPEVDPALPVRDVLIHELAHVRRRDCFWNLLRRLAEAAFFYQPLLWVLTRRIEVTAEEVCDDYVVQLGGNREEYAHRLVDIAELCSVPVGAAGVAMVSLRSILAQRVGRILDTSRSLSTRDGNLLLALVIAVGLIGTASVGLIGLDAQPLLATDDPAEAKPSDQDKAKDRDAAPTKSEKAKTEKSADDKVLEGRVTDDKGNPISGVHVAVIARLIQPARGGDFDASSAVLTEGTTDKDGQYRLSLKGVSPKTHAYATLIARKEGMGLAWQQRDLDAPKEYAPLKLVAEEPIRVKLLDVKGKPAAGVRLAIRSIVQRREGGFATEGIGYANDKKLPDAWLPPVTADTEGRLVIHGVPAGHGVYLEVEKTDRFAPQDISLNTGAPDERGERDGTYRSLVKNVKPSEEAVLSLPPPQPFEGVVRYADTGEVAPHARITIWASDQEPFGSMVSVAGKADDKGRYRIIPKPGIRFGVTAYPPDGTPYLARQSAQDGIRWEAGDEVKEVNVTLPRGVLLKGKIVEAGTTTPVAGVSVQYIPERRNNPNMSDDILTGWQALQLSDKNGEFSIVALPGPGRLLAHSAVGNYVFQETSDRELAIGKPGGERTYAHAIVKIEPEAGSDPMDLKLELQPGATATGRMVDEGGEPIREALIVSRLNVSPLSLDWRGYSEPVLGGRFELTRLAKDVAYPVYFLDAKRQLGAVEMIKAGDKDRTIVLKPCGKAKLRLVNSKGEPVAGSDVTPLMVVTPGASRYDMEAFRKGELCADVDFIGNVDRTNYLDWRKSDKDGNFILPALIPGASYQIAAVRGDRGLQVVKEFQAKSNETLELGELVVEGKK
jgi:beta-lactamase regulating signal transducer with metallopeptidase domain